MATRKSPWPITRCFALQLVLLGCASQDHASIETPVEAGLVDGADAAQAQTDAGHPIPGDAAADGDAAESADAATATMPNEPLQVSLDLMALLREIERGTFATCPCRVEAGQYASIQECVEDVRFEAGWEDCAALVPVPEGNEEAVRCAADELRRRNDCLATAPCSIEHVNVCRSDMLECPKLEAEVLSRVVVWCHGAIILFH